MIFLGIVTGIGGGMIRDMMAGEMPFVLYKRIYAVAAIAGGSICAVLIEKDIYLAVGAGTLVTVLIRMLAAHYCWNLPKAVLDETKQKG